MKELPILTFSLLIFSCTTSRVEKDAALTLQSAFPGDFGLDQKEIAMIESHIQWAMDISLISGAVALIAKENNIIYHQAFGFSDRAKTKLMNTNSIFRLASMTKPITTTAIMQLVEQEKIGLDDPVSKFIPELANMNVLDTWNQMDSSFTTTSLERPITIHHLLTHTSGIPYQAFDPVAGALYAKLNYTEAWTKDPITLEGNIPRLADAPLMHQPGTAWTYGTGIDVLGRVVEVASGMPLDKYLIQNIFDPLDMEDTRFYLPEEKASKLVDLWFTQEFDQATQNLIGADYPIAGAQTYFAGGAGLVGTSMDYLRFASALLNKGTLSDAKILEAATVDMMFQNQIDTLRSGKGRGFGYGGMVQMEEGNAGKNIGTWGWTGFWQTSFSVDPANELILILMTNAFPNPRPDVLGRYDELVFQFMEN